MKKDDKLKIAVADCETDPFAYDRKPQPFVWGFEAVDLPFVHFWADTEKDGVIRTRDEIAEDCCTQFIDYLYSLPDAYCIYMHNGGKFDFMFLMKHIEGNLRIVNGRILEAHIGPHTIRDSYAAIPVSLATYKKDDIDYDLLEIETRENNRYEIVKYLGGDCRYLLEMVTRFREEFGNVLTIGSAAMRAVKKFHAFEEFNADQDTEFRDYYFGGRNQCFEVGEIKGAFKTYDKNSSYPHVMSSYLHPVSNTCEVSNEFDHNTDFVHVVGRNYGGLPKRIKDSLSFVETEGEFKVTGHELRAALETGTFEIESIIKAYTFTTRVTFEEFVNHFYGLRLESAANKDDLLVLFYKLILNSGYGKFALNSDNFKDWTITDDDLMAMDPDIWTPEIQSGDFILWAKRSPQKKFYNVATGASITGAARTELLLGLAKAERPIYCDTDSIKCLSLKTEADPKKLGAWKLESECDTVYIAGKKLYVDYKDGKPYVDEKGRFKKASKGARLTPEQIKNAALGGTEVYSNPAPTFHLDGTVDFMTRTIRKTGHNIFPFSRR